MEMLCYLKLTEFLCLLCVCSPVLGVFIWNFLTCLCWRERYSLFSRPCSSATRFLKLFLFSFPGRINSPIFSAPQNFSPISLQHRLCLPGCLSASYLTVTSLSRWFVSDTFQVSFSRCCTFSKLLLEMTEWLTSWLKLFSPFVL